MQTAQGGEAESLTAVRLVTRSRIEALAAAALAAPSAVEEGRVRLQPA